MKTLVGDYNDGSVFNTATQVDFNQLFRVSGTPRSQIGAWSQISQTCVFCVTSAETLGCLCSVPLGGFRSIRSHFLCLPSSL